MKLIIIGDGRAGKDTAAEILHKNFGLNFSSSSLAAAKIFIYDTLKEKYDYKSFEECYADRHTKRDKWFDLITEYNKDNASRLAEQILKDNDVYVGMRSEREILKCKDDGLVDLVVGIYNPRVPKEPKTSNQIDVFKHSDVVIFNDTTIENFEKKIVAVFGNMFPQKKVSEYSYKRTCYNRFFTKNKQPIENFLKVNMGILPKIQNQQEVFIELAYLLSDGVFNKCDTCGDYNELYEFEI